MDHKELTEILHTLRRVREVSTMEKSHFHSSVDEDVMDYVPLPKQETEVTEFVRKRTCRWRGSWIIDPLDRIIRVLEKGLEIV